MPNEGLYRSLAARIEPYKRGSERVDERDQTKVRELAALINGAQADLGWTLYKKLYDLLHLTSQRTD